MKSWFKTPGCPHRTKINIVFFFSALTITLLSPPLIREDKHPILANAFDSLGWLIFLAGASFRILATLYIGGRKGRELVTEGPYAICRNPLYFGSFLFGISAALFLKSLLFALSVFFWAMLYKLVIAEEEKELKQKFGQAYEEYKKKVPLFLPRFPLYHTKQTFQIYLKPLKREMCRAVLFYIWIPILGEWLNIFRSFPWWPHPLPFF